MTLTAITSERELFNPSARIEAGDSEIEVVKLMRQLSAMGLYCPHCYRRIGAMVPVKFRNPNERRKHFFHLDALGENSECHNYSKESEDHLEAKLALKEALARKYPQAIVDVEKLLQEGKVRRTPDVVVTFPNNAKEAHEVQLSAINLDGLRQRSDAIRGMNCRVLWYLGQKNWTTENRDYLRSAGIPYFKIYRNDGQFKWKEDMGDERPDQPTGRDSDNCGRTNRFNKKAGARPVIDQADPEFLEQERERERQRWENHISQYQPSSLPIELGCKVRHSLDYVEKHQWIGDVIWVDASGSISDVDWGRYAQKPYPDRFPIRLLDRMDRRFGDG